MIAYGAGDRPGSCHSTGSLTVVWVSTPCTYPNDPSTGASMSAMPALSGVAVYRTGIGPAAGTGGGWPSARDCPVVVENVYTYPGRSRVTKTPLRERMSPRRMNRPGPRRLVLHTCTTCAGKPPVTWMVTCCAAVAVEVCATIDQAERQGARKVTYEPPAGRRPFAPAA